MSSKKRILITYSIILVVSSLAYVVRMNLLNLQVSWQVNLKFWALSVVLISSFWEGIRFINRSLAKRYPIRTKPWQRVSIQVLSGIAILFTIRYIGFYYLGEYFPPEYNSKFRFAVYLVDVFFSALVNSIFFIREYVKDLKHTQLRAERLEKEKTQVQFDNLKNQLNPHFLFNALTSLNSLIHSNPGLASDFLQQMSRVYRYVLQHKSKEQVSLRTELEFIENYVFLLKTRFGEGLQIRFRITESALEKGIVPVTTQILLENAIKHNVLNAMRPLEIEVFDEGGFLCVKNKLQRKKIVEHSNKQGIDNLKSLYRFLSEDQVTIVEDDYYFTVKVPLLK